MHGDTRYVKPYHIIYVELHNNVICIYMKKIVMRQVGLLGQKLQIYREENIDNVKWNNIEGSSNQPLTWYKVYVIDVHCNKYRKSKYFPSIRSLHYSD